MEWLITPAELAEILNTRPAGITLVDVREPEENRECRILDGPLIPLGEIRRRGAKELDPDADIVLYCAHGVRSMYALTALRQMGFEKLRSLQGGICAWQKEGYAQISPKS